MNKTPRNLIIALAVGLPIGVAFVSCGQFSSGAGAGAGTGGGPGSGGTKAASGGDTGSGGATGSGGDIGPGETGGDSGSTGTGGDSSGGGTGGSGAGSGGSGTGSGGRTATGGASGNAGARGSGGANGSGGIIGMAGDTPCSILAAGNNACVAAHSTVRVVYPGYSGPLYQVCKGSFVAGPKSCTSGMTMDIGSLPGGYANAAAQDTFCTGGTCTITTIYDQSPNKNDLKPAPAGGAGRTPDNPVVADALPTKLNGHTVYGVFIKNGMGYRSGCSACDTPTAKGTATADQPETEYMVTSQKGLVNGCCFDYGNAETTSRDDGNGTMEAVYFGGGVVWGTGSPGGHANGPWVMADLENGLYAGWERNQDQNISTNTPMKFDFVTAIVVGDVASQNAGKGRFALYGGNAAAAGPLTTLYDGVRPAKPGYVPMKKPGSIILGIGGDNSKSTGGQWFEGVMASGASTVATLNALQANIVAAGYGK